MEEEVEDGVGSADVQAESREVEEAFRRDEELQGERGEDGEGWLGRIAGLCTAR